MFTTFHAYGTTTDDFLTEDLAVVETFDAEDDSQACSILEEAGYVVLDVVDTMILVTR